MPTPKLDDERRRQFTRRAISHAESLAAAAADTPVMAELLNQQVVWTESRLLVQHHLNILQAVTGFTVVLDGADPRRVLGWQVDKRRDTSQDKRLADDEIVARARTLPQIGPDLALQRISVESVAAPKSFSVARFGADPAKSFDVAVNHSTGELIGVLPLRVGKATPLNVPGPGTDAGEQAAWQILEAQLLQKTDRETVDQARAMLRFVPQRASRDDAGRTSFVYRLWRPWSTADVGIAAATGEVVNWYVEGLQADAPERKLGEADAVRIAQVQLQGPPVIASGLQGPTVSFGEVGGEQKATVHWWHAEQGCGVEGDQLTVLLNAQSGAVFSVARKWRTVAPELLAPPKLDAAQSLAAASRATGLSTPGHLIGRSVIEVGGDAADPDAVRDRSVWRVGFQDGVTFTEMAIDAFSGEVVRVTGW
jgi:hypothetical protein